MNILLDTIVDDQDHYRVPCGFPGCKKTYAGKGACWRKHRESCPFKSANLCSDEENPKEAESDEQQMEETDKKEHQDYVFNYSCSILREGLLDWAREDASKENDGDRAIALWKMDFLRFHAHGNTKYRILAFDLIAKLLATLPPRMAAQLKYNRCMNVNGGTGHNIACDLGLELLNKECKRHLKNSGTITDKVLKRVGNCIKPLNDLMENIDEEAQFYSSVGRRNHPSYSEEVKNLVLHLSKSDLFENIPERKHQAFPNFQRDKEVNGNTLNNWIKKRKEVLAKEERLRYQC